MDTRIGRKIVTVAAIFVGLSRMTTPAEPTASDYVWKNVAIGGGGFVTGILFHPRERGLVYVRTDVGGAYRRDDPSHPWIPLTDWLPGIDFTGIESFAVDPSDPGRIYLAAGIYRSTRAAILHSADRGRTWQTTEVPFKMGGNESGRFNGERLAVDPGDGRILFFGSRYDGLWKSADRGATWNRVPGFPRVDTVEAPPLASRRRFNFAPQEIGIVFVQFVPQGGRMAIYAGVSASGTNLFVSVDGGTNWSAVPGQPTGLRPNHAAPARDGAIYLTYGEQAGPATMTDGAVWKFQPKEKLWTDITPLKSPDRGQSFGYGAVSVEAQDPAVLVVTTFGRWQPHDEIFRSVDGGASWRPLLDRAQFDHASAPYTRNRTPHWMGSIEIDPFDANHVLFATGYGVWESTNVTDADAGKPVRWSFGDDGLEETVPLALISPPAGAHLLSGLGDIDGFRHDDLGISPVQGTFAGVHFNNTLDLAFAAENPSVMVRTGTGNNDAHAAISHDGGKNWEAFAAEPEGGYSGGTITISSDGKNIGWSPRRVAPECSSDGGTNWTVCAGLSPGTPMIADPVNPLRFYAFDFRSGKVFGSTNGAKSFVETAEPVSGPDPADGGLGFGFGFGSGGELAAAPGREADLWLTLRAGGLYHSADGGRTFQRLANVEDAGAIGFGKAADGMNFPAVYLTGKIDGVAGIFCSIDAGANWIRINDDAHRFGTITGLTGDPRVFGRVYLATSGRGVIYGEIK